MCSRKLTVALYSAHPKIDPETREMIFFGYNQSRPFVHYGILTPDGLMRQLIDINIPRSVMMHDFAITKVSTPLFLTFRWTK